MMGDVIEFPMERRRREVFDAEQHIGVTYGDGGEMTPVSMDKCADLIHVFTEAPGRCQCGKNEWTPDHNIKPYGIGIHAVFDPPPSAS